MTNTWQLIQHSIWDCSVCHDIGRVSLTIRQQTAPPKTPTKLLIVGIAPPFQKNVYEKIRAKSATNDPDDELRKFIETSINLPYDRLTEQGLAVLHAAKCAIYPKDGHQNPPHGVVENCAPRHFALELFELKPSVVLSLGERARRAVLIMPALQKPKGLRLSGPLHGQFEMRVESHPFTLIVSPFFRQNRNQAGNILKTASKLAGLLQVEL